MTTPSLPNTLERVDVWTHKHLLRFGLWPLGGQKTPILTRYSEDLGRLGNYREKKPICFFPGHVFRYVFLGVHIPSGGV